MNYLHVAYPRDSWPVDNLLATRNEMRSAELSIGVRKKIIEPGKLFSFQINTPFVGDGVAPTHQDWAGQKPLEPRRAR
jgi:hypothetical protein